MRKYGKILIISSGMLLAVLVIGLFVTGGNKVSAVTYGLSDTTPNPDNSVPSGSHVHFMRISPEVRRL
jgi:hypothetical protein